MPPQVEAVPHFLDYFVVGSQLVLRSAHRVEIDWLAADEPFPLELEIVHDDAGRVGTAGARVAGDDHELEISWAADTRGRRPELDRMQAWRLFSRVCAKLPPYESTLRIATDQDGLDGLEADGYVRSASGYWVGSKAEVRLRKIAKVTSPDQLYADPLLVPWNEEPREWELLDRLLAEARGAGLSTRMLDLGCGFGPSSTALEQHGLAVYGIDMSPNAIRRCRQLVRHPERFNVASAQRMPFEDGFFDFALDIGCLHCVPDELRQRAVRDVARVLRPRGVLFSRFFKPRDQEWIDRQPLAVTRVGLEATELHDLLMPYFEITESWERGAANFVRALSRSSRSLPI